MSRGAERAQAYVLLHVAPAALAQAQLETARRALRAARWRCAGAAEALEVWTPPGARTAVVQVGRRHLLIGRWRGGSQSLSAVIGASRSAQGLARAAVSAGWGDYVLAWVTDERQLALLRSPAGALDCLCWRLGAITLAAHDLHEALAPLWPERLAINWPVLSDIAGAIELLSDRPALRGLSAVGAGDLALIGDEPQTRAIWRPADLYQPRDGWDEDPDGLRRVVDETTAALVQGQDLLLAEVSGGLDSAIVAGSLRARAPGVPARFISFHDHSAEGDERLYARAAADLLGFELHEAAKPVQAWTKARLLDLPQGARPALHGLDLAYDAEVAARCRTEGVTGLLTGQGGDAVFFQGAHPHVIVDLRARLGIGAFHPRRLTALAQWSRHSAWTLARIALQRPSWRPASGLGVRHPWLQDLERLPPAKAAQVHRFVNAQLFWGDCRRTRAADLLHPLLSQPVVEHCLRLPIDILTQGPRDRGLARRAFADRLPAQIIARHDKGDLSGFYSLVVRSSASFLRSFLAEGLLAQRRIVDPVQIVRELDETRLIWDPASNRFLILAMLEAWARHWERRLG